MTLASAYRSFLEQVDRWFGAATARHPGVVPCRAGCSACCHGPFDITAADVLLLEEALARLDRATRAEVDQRLSATWSRIMELAPGWAVPFDVAELGEARFDAVAQALANEPCPLLDAQGRCRVYDSRPLVCRLIGLGIEASTGEVLPNACPIQDEFPAYAALAPTPLDLHRLHEEEAAHLRAAAVELFGDEARWEYETTIAALGRVRVRR